jgi:hypothetical protein
MISAPSRWGCADKDEGDDESNAMPAEVESKKRSGTTRLRLISRVHYAYVG